MKLTTKAQKQTWAKDASQLFGSRIWGNPMRPNTNYKFLGFSDKVEPKKVKRNGSEIEILERFIFIKNLDNNQDLEINCKYFFTTYNEGEELSSPTVYGLGDGVIDPVDLLFESVEAQKQFTIEYITAYSLDFQHWTKHQERKLIENKKAIKYIIA